MARDEPVGRGSLNARVPGRNDGSQQGECHHGNTYAEDRKQAPQLVTQRVAQKKSNELHLGELALLQMPYRAGPLRSPGIVGNHKNSFLELAVEPIH
jgi:hypothetical protein